MSNLLKMIKLELKNNFMIFLGLNIMTVVTLLLAAIFTNVIFLHGVRSINQDVGVATDISELFSSGLMNLFIIVSFLLVVIYTWVSLMRKFSTSDGTVYTVMQLPVSKNTHLASSYIGSMLFSLVNGGLVYVMVYIYSRILRIEMLNIVRTTSTYDTRVPSVTKLMEMFFSGNPFFTMNVENLMIVLFKWFVIIGLIITIVLFIKGVKYSPVYTILSVVVLSFCTVNIVEFLGWGQGGAYQSYQQYIIKLLLALFLPMIANLILIRKLEY